MFYRLKSSEKPGSWNSSYAARPKLATDLIQTIGTCYMSSQLIHWCSLDADQQIRPCPRELACSLIHNSSSRCLTPWLHNYWQSVRINFKDAWGASGGMRNDQSRKVWSFRIQVLRLTHSKLAPSDSWSYSCIASRVDQLTWHVDYWQHQNEALYL